MLFLRHPLECLMLFGSRIKYLNALILCCNISSRATLTIVFTLAKPRDIICTDNFKIMENSLSICFLQLKESLLSLKLKRSLNVAKKSMPLYLFDNDF